MGTLVREMGGGGEGVCVCMCVHDNRVCTTSIIRVDNRMDFFF